MPRRENLTNPLPTRYDLTITQSRERSLPMTHETMHMEREFCLAISHERMHALQVTIYNMD